MPAPTFVAEYETSWAASSAAKTTSSFNAQSGDLLVLHAVSEDNATYQLPTPTNTQGALTWTLRQSVTVDAYCTNYVWTAPVTAAKTGMTVSIAGPGGFSTGFGFTVLHYRDTGGVGNSAKTNASGAPSLALATSQTDSAVTTSVGDWNAADGTSRTWRTVGVTATEQTYFRDASRYTVYVARYSNAGAAGAKTTGLSAPSGLKYSIISLEVLGVASEGIPEGTGSVTVTVGLAGAGETTRSGSGAVGLEVGLTGVGAADRTGSGSTGVTVGFAGAGSVERQGTGNIDFSVALTGSGAVDRAGSGSTGITVSLVGAGVTPPEDEIPTGTGHLQLQVELTGSGSTDRSGTGSVGVTIAASGVGEVLRTGTGTTGVTVSLTGAGVTPPDVPTGTGHVQIAVGLAGAGEVVRTGSSAVGVTVSVGQVIDEATEVVFTITSYRLWSSTTSRTVYAVRTGHLWEVSSGLLNPG